MELPRGVTPGCCKECDDLIELFPSLLAVPEFNKLSTSSRPDWVKKALPWAVYLIHDQESSIYGLPEKVRTGHVRKLLKGPNGSDPLEKYVDVYKRLAKSYQELVETPGMRAYASAKRGHDAFVEYMDQLLSEGDRELAATQVPKMVKSLEEMGRSLEELHKKAKADMAQKTSETYGNFTETLADKGAL